MTKCECGEKATFRCPFQGALCYECMDECRSCEYPDVNGNILGCESVVCDYEKGDYPI